MVDDRRLEEGDADAEDEPFPEFASSSAMISASETGVDVSGGLTQLGVLLCVCSGDCVDNDEVVAVMDGLRVSGVLVPEEV